MTGAAACPGCGWIAAGDSSGPPPPAATGRACWGRYAELAAWSLALRDPAFLHQHVVDAYPAQHAGPGVKPIQTLFALVGLHLALDRGWTGREVQRAHVALGLGSRDWPVFPPPSRPGWLTAADVLKVAEGPQRVSMVMTWMASVWRAWAPAHEEVRSFLAGRPELSNERRVRQGES